jgi:hypothetical protein
MRVYIWSWLYNCRCHHEMMHTCAKQSVIIIDPNDIQQCVTLYL